MMKFRNGVCEPERLASNIAQTLPFYVRIQKGSTKKKCSFVVFLTGLFPRPHSHPPNPTTQKEQSCSGCVYVCVFQVKPIVLQQCDKSIRLRALSFERKSQSILSTLTDNERYLLLQSFAQAYQGLGCCGNKSKNSLWDSNQSKSST